MSSPLPATVTFINGSILQGTKLKLLGKRMDWQIPLKIFSNTKVLLYRVFDTYFPPTFTGGN